MKKGPEKTQMTIYLEKAIHEKFISACKAERRTISEQVSIIIENWLFNDKRSSTHLSGDLDGIEIAEAQESDLEKDTSQQSAGLQKKQA